MRTFISLLVRSLSSLIVSLFFIYAPAVAASMSHLYGNIGTPVPASDELDIKNLDEGEFIDFLETKNGKTFCEKYRNSLGRNLVFLAARDGQFKLLRKMKEKKIDISSMLRTGHIEDIVKDKNVDEFLEIAPELITDHSVRNIFLEVNFKALKSLSFDTSLWDQVEESKYLTLLSKNATLKPHLPEEFIFVGLGTVLDHEQSLIRTSFLQQDFAKREDANLSWYYFIEKYDKLSSQSSTKLPYTVRILEIVQVFKKQNEDCGYSKDLEEIITLQSKALATGGTFGMNFKRTATAEEAEIMIASLESIGYDLGNVQKILNALFVKYHQDLGETQKYQLENHQINCAVIALHSALFEYHDDDVFETIDSVLAKKLSGLRANSKERHSKLMELAGRTSIRTEDEDLSYGNFSSYDEFHIPTKTKEYDTQEESKINFF